MGADFYKDVESIHDRLTKNAYPLQLPIGTESNFSGIIDLIKMKAFIYFDEMGKDIREERDTRPTWWTSPRNSATR